MTDLQQPTRSLEQAATERDRLIAAQRQTISDRNTEIVRLAEELAALRASTSWRITRPLRSAGKLIRRWGLRRRRSREMRHAHGTSEVLKTTIVKSGLFDAEWYVANYPDVARAGLEPLQHYMATGAAEGRDPGPLFSTRGYLARNPDILGTGVNPLVHFLLHGSTEGAPVDGALQLADVKKRFREQCRSALTAFLSEKKRIVLPTCEQPDVSIIIVLFNQAELTLECLRSLASALDVPSEVIIVDNASSDLTVELCAHLDGAHVIRNETNIHFLNAVNQAAVHARGTAVLLLNNDTRVRPGSIGAAYDLLRQQEDVGAVGGKIVLLDGSLQEAGSIVWSDGRCAGHGRGRPPFSPEFQFRRDVDYCSGAFLLVRRSLFERLNRFDTRFAPAYYEETDLCMRIRDAGFRVVYEPRVEILHFEFGSASLPEEALALQKRNQKIFLERHGDALLKRHHKPGTRQLEARIHGRHAHRVLVIDDRVPSPSLGLGFPRARSLLHGIHRAGWFVTFYPLIFPRVAWEEAYRLLPTEIEIMADQGPAGLSSFIRDRVGYYDAVLVSRPHNMEIVNQVMKDNPDFLERTKLVYDAEAITSEREALRLKLAGTSLSISEHRKMRSKEMALAENAAVVAAVNEKEARIFRESLDADVHVLGHAITVEAASTPFQDRADILFVGALDHDVSPNVDSLVWFVNDIMPLLDRLLGMEYRLNIIGSGGSRRVRELAGPRVHLRGTVDDLGAYYSRSRIFIAPTRYAAGIPMKVHEAAGAGLPVVATTLLADQLGWKDGVELLTADGSEDFARACHRLYADEQLWRRLRENALERARKECNPVEFSTRVASMLAAIVDAAVPAAGPG